MASIASLLKADNERRARGYTVEPTGYITVDGEAMAFWLGEGLSAKDVLRRDIQTAKPAVAFSGRIMKIVKDNEPGEVGDNAESIA